MPYIKPENRTALRLRTALPDDAGELNFMLTELVLRYLSLHGRRYRTMNDIVGALECCKQEFIRRVVNPYESEKIEENGDIWGFLP